jgi:hypothetical protein
VSKLQKGHDVKWRTDKNDKSQITREVLAYLADHPEAQDTLEGIIEWWLLEQQIKRHTERVKECMADLVTQGLVIEHQSIDAHVRYQMNPARLSEIRKLIEKETE